MAIPLDQLKIIEENNTNKEDEIEIVRILKHRIKNGSRQFYVKRVGYDHRHNRWINESDFITRECIDEYLKTQSINVIQSVYNISTYVNTNTINNSTLILLMFLLKPE
jgi:phage terminase large subunit